VTTNKNWDTGYEFKAVLLLTLGFGLVGLDRWILPPLFPTMMKDLGLGREVALLRPGGVDKQLSYDPETPLISDLSLVAAQLNAKANGLSFEISVEDWLAESVTHSPVAMLDDDTRTVLLADLRTALTERIGGQIDVRYETRVTSARRR